MNADDTGLVVGRTPRARRSSRRRFRGPALVAAFNTVPSEVLFGVFEARAKPAGPAWSTAATTQAQRVAAGLIRDVGFDPVDAGPFGSPATPSRSRCSSPSSRTRETRGRSWRTGSSGSAKRSGRCISLEKRKLGQQGLEVSGVGLGYMGMSQSYGATRWPRPRSPASTSSRTGSRRGTDRGSRPEHIRRAFDDSLRCLQMDYTDLLYQYPEVDFRREVLPLPGRKLRRQHAACGGGARAWRGRSASSRDRWP